MEEDPSDIRAVLDRYTEEDWKTLWKRLMLFTYRHYWWLPSTVRGVVSLEDLIQDSITDVIEGKRHWPPDIPVETFLCQVIRSKASHIREKEGRVLPASEMPSLPCPERTLTAEVDRQQWAQGILELLRGNKILCLIAEKWIRDPDLRPHEIASSLGLSPAEMRNAQKRLMRKVASLREG